MTFDLMNTFLASWLNSVPDDPFYLPRKPLWYPSEMANAPSFPSGASATVERHYALLLNPFYPKDPHASFGKHVLTPTLALTSIAAATPKHWRVRYWDENLLQGFAPVEPLPQVVGITVHLTFAKRAYALARWFRARGCTVVLGGLHVLSCPDEAGAHADAIVMGDGVQAWPVVLGDLERGAVKPRYAAMYDNDYNEDPAPRRELLPKESFLTTASLIATRGCHNRCGFCYLATEGLRMPYRVREPGDIRDQFERSGEPYAVFIDNNLGSKPDYLRALCQQLRPLRRIWSAAVTLDVTDDPWLVRDMALAGCTGVFVGFESLSDDNLAASRKRTPRTEDYARRIRLFHENGIQVNGSFVLGFDEDRTDAFARLAQWVETNRLECATFHILTPYPGTPLFRQMERENRLLHRDWEKYDTAHVVFRPKHMSPEELQLGYDWLYRRLFSVASIWRRRPEQRSAVLPYLAMSFLYKRSNRFWHLLVKHRLVHAVWSPLVHWTRFRHVAFRRRLIRHRVNGQWFAGSGNVVAAGV
ncbi:MAG: B12-binding domain-containing radical SAM protein [Verrucomicrobia bacterium]|nr:B12-binding domain-containing radical SAM protein [Verrucomicrobiota bacterium]